MLGVCVLAKELRKSYSEENYTSCDMIIYPRNIIAHKSYFVVHTAQALRGNSEEAKPVGLQCLLRGAEFRRAGLSHTPPNSNITLIHPSLRCMRCTSPRTCLVLQWTLMLIAVS